MGQLKNGFFSVVFIVVAQLGNTLNRLINKKPKNKHVNLENNNLI